MEREYVLLPFEVEAARSLPTGRARPDTVNAETARRIKIDKIFFIVNDVECERETASS